MITSHTHRQILLQLILNGIGWDIGDSSANRCFWEGIGNRRRLFQKISLEVMTVPTKEDDDGELGEDNLLELLVRLDSGAKI